MNTHRKEPRRLPPAFHILFLVSCMLLLSEDSEGTAITIKLTWTAEAGLYTSISDLDLYVTEPSGEVASSSNTTTTLGGQLDASDSSPETYRMESGYGGNYKVAVKYPAYGTQNPQEALVTVQLDDTSFFTLGSETLGETVGSTWYVGEFDYPGGQILSQGAQIMVKLLWTAETSVYTSVSDLDLYVTEPTGEIASPSNPTTGLGGQLDGDDIGPEFYQMERGENGDYTIAVKYPSYDTENPQEASVTIIFYKGSDSETFINFGSELLGESVGPTWHVGTFNFPSGEITVEEDSSGFGCFIATAAYGSPLANEVFYLRSFRNRYLVGNKTGRAFLRLYYRSSPTFAESIRKHPFSRALLRAVLKPLILVARFIGGETEE